MQLKNIFLYLVMFNEKKLKSIDQRMLEMSVVLLWVGHARMLFIMASSQRGGRTKPSKSLILRLRNLQQIAHVCRSRGTTPWASTCIDIRTFFA
jgi:hypothetical protein